MNSFFTLLFCASVIGLIITLLIPFFRRKKDDNKLFTPRRSALFLGFSILLAVSVVNLNGSEPAQSYETQSEGRDYVEKLRPVYNSQYQLAGVVSPTTVDINQNGTVSRVRVIGIETPPNLTPAQSECINNQANARLNEYLAGKTIELESDGSQGESAGQDMLLRHIRANDELIAQKIIAEGLAVPSPSGAHKYQADFAGAQATATNNGVGVWSKNICGLNHSGASASSSSSPSAGNSSGAPAQSPSGGSGPSGGTANDRSCNPGLINAIIGLFGGC